MNIRQFIRDAGNVLFSNLLMAIVSGLNVLIIPKLIGVEQYGYWQLFLFVSSYVLLAQLGLGDGAYLRYGGMRYSELLKYSIRAQLALLSIHLLIIAAFLATLTHKYISDPDRAAVYYCALGFMVIVNLRHFLNLLFQGTAEFIAFRKITVIDRIVFVSLVGLFLILGAREYGLLIAAELSAAMSSLALAFLYSKEILKPMAGTINAVFRELIQNLVSGLKLTLANTGNMLIVGTARLAIDAAWGVAVFGMISLSWNLSTMMMVFVNALGLVLFPMLRRMNQSSLPQFYQSVRPLISLVTLTLLLAEFPLRWALTLWLPEYSDGLRFVSLLMPLLVYETNMGLLNNPILKALRRENSLLVINGSALGLSIVITYVGVSFRSIEVIVLGMLLSIALRGVLGEILVRSHLQSHRMGSIVAEAILVSISVGSAWFIDGWLGSFCYAIALAVYFVIRRHEFGAAIRWLGTLVSRLRG